MIQTSSGPVLEAHELRFAYPERRVFEGLSARFRAGLTVVRGPNGCGKSTLLKLLGGALDPSSGTLTIRGLPASADPVGYRREVFWCGPGEIAFDHLTAAEFLGFMQSLYPRFSAATAQDFVSGFQLAPFVHQRLSELSTGSQRKVWLTAAMAAGTAAVLIDEPLNALDQSARTFWLDALRRHATNESQAWIVASHEWLGDAEEIAGDVMELGLI